MTRHWTTPTTDEDMGAYLDRHEDLSTPGWIIKILWTAIADTSDCVHAHDRAATARLEALEAKLAELEHKSSAPSCHWEGVFVQGKRYSPGSLVTDHGSLWLTVRSTADRPGTSRDYTLIVKRGEAER